MEWLHIITLALIQGITEFLPISSSAHLVLPAQLFNWPDQGLAFDIAVHVGSLAAVLIYFRQDLGAQAAGIWGITAHRRLDAPALEVGKIALATLPVVVCGFLARSWVETELRSIGVVAMATILFGLLLGYADTRHGPRSAVSWRDALFIGAAQVLALVPGTSRSGITITAALLVGLSRTSAARFSFLLSIPTIAGAGILATAELLDQGDRVPWIKLAGAAVLSGTAAYLCIGAFIRLVERTGMMPYVIYRLVLGTALLTIWWDFWG